MVEEDLPVTKKKKKKKRWKFPHPVHSAPLCLIRWRLCSPYVSDE